MSLQKNYPYIYRFRKKIISKIVIVGFAFGLAFFPKIINSHSVEITSVKRSDYISHEDIKKASGNYNLYVKGIGSVLIKEVRTAEGSSRECMVEKESLRKLIKVAFQNTQGPTWISLNRITVPKELELDIDYLCIGEGSGCYILVSPSVEAL